MFKPVVHAVKKFFQLVTDTSEAFTQHRLSQVFIYTDFNKSVQGIVNAKVMKVVCPDGQEQVMALGDLFRVQKNEVFFIGQRQMNRQGFQKRHHSGS